RRRRARWPEPATSLLQVVEHPVDRRPDLLFGQGRVAALRRHYAGAAGVALDRVAVQGLGALGDARGPLAGDQGRRSTGARAVAARAQVLVDHRAVQGAAVGDLRRGGSRGGGGGRGLGGGAGAAGIDRADRGDAVLGALGGGRVDLRGQHAVERDRGDDQAKRDRDQEGDHQRKALEELKVVIAHENTLGRRQTGR